MGLAASQARVLSLTSRMLDLELRSQMLSNQKVALANASSHASAKYVNALNGEHLSIYTPEGDYVDATASLLTSHDAFTGMDQLFLQDDLGQILCSEDVMRAYNAAGGDLEKFLNRFGCTQNTSAVKTINDVSSLLSSDLKSVSSYAENIRLGNVLSDSKSGVNIDKLKSLSGDAYASINGADVYENGVSSHVTGLRETSFLPDAAPDSYKSSVLNIANSLLASSCQLEGIDPQTGDYFKDSNGFYEIAVQKDSNGTPVLDSDGNQIKLILNEEIYSYAQKAMDTYNDGYVNFNPYSYQQDGISANIIELLKNKKGQDTSGATQVNFNAVNLFSQGKSSDIYGFTEIASSAVCAEFKNKLPESEYQKVVNAADLASTALVTQMINESKSVASYQVPAWYNDDSVLVDGTVDSGSNITDYNELKQKFKTGTVVYSQSNKTINTDYNTLINLYMAYFNAIVSDSVYSTVANENGLQKGINSIFTSGVAAVDSGDFNYDTYFYVTEEGTEEKRFIRELTATHYYMHQFKWFGTPDNPGPDNYQQKPNFTPKGPYNIIEYDKNTVSSSTVQYWHIFKWGEDRNTSTTSHWKEYEKHRTLTIGNTKNITTFKDEIMNQLNKYVNNVNNYTNTQFTNAPLVADNEVEYTKKIFDYAKNENGKLAIIGDISYSKQTLSLSEEEYAAAIINGKLKGDDLQAAFDAGENVIFQHKRQDISSSQSYNPNLVWKEVESSPNTVDKWLCATDSDGTVLWKKKNDPDGFILRQSADSNGSMLTRQSTADDYNLNWTKVDAAIRGKNTWYTAIDDNGTQYWKDENGLVFSQSVRSNGAPQFAQSVDPITGEPLWEDDIDENGNPVMIPEVIDGVTTKIHTLIDPNGDPNDESNWKMVQSVVNGVPQYGTKQEPVMETVTLPVLDEDGNPVLDEDGEPTYERVTRQKVDDEGNPVFNTVTDYDNPIMEYAMEDKMVVRQKAITEPVLQNATQPVLENVIDDYLGTRYMDTDGSYKISENLIKTGVVDQAFIDELVSKGADAEQYKDFLGTNYRFVDDIPESYFKISFNDNGNITEMNTDNANNYFKNLLHSFGYNDNELSGKSLDELCEMYKEAFDNNEDLNFEKQRQYQQSLKASSSTTTYTKGNTGTDASVLDTSGFEQYSKEFIKQYSDYLEDKLDSINLNGLEKMFETQINKKNSSIASLKELLSNIEPTVKTYLEDASSFFGIDFPYTKDIDDEVKKLKSLATKKNFDNDDIAAIKEGLSQISKKAKIPTSCEVKYSDQNTIDYYTNLFEKLKESESKGRIVSIDKATWNDSEWLKNQLKIGNLHVSVVGDDGTLVRKQYNTSFTYLAQDTLSDAELTKAQAEYEKEVASISKKEKKIDRELAMLETEHNAIEKELENMDTVKKDNIEDNFNLFS